MIPQWRKPRERRFGFFSLGDVMENGNDSINTIRSLNGEVGSEEVPFAELGISVFQAVADDLTLKTFVQFFPGNRLEDVLVDNFRDRMPYDLFFLRAAIIKLRPVGM